jgi:hypothetical protein
MSATNAKQAKFLMTGQRTNDRQDAKAGLLRLGRGSAKDCLLALGRFA